MSWLGICTFIGVGVGRMRRFNEVVSFKCDGYILDMLDELCRYLSTSRSQVIRYAIIRYYNDVVKDLGGNGRQRIRVKRVVLK